MSEMGEVTSLTSLTNLVKMAKMLMGMGVLIFLAGLLVYILSKSGFAGIPFGKLPGDISWQGKNVKIFIPITSMIIASVLLTVILNIISRFGGK